MRTVSVIYNLLSTMCSTRLTELVSGEAKAYYDDMLAQMKVLGDCAWDEF